MWSWASYSLCLSSSIHKTGILRALLIKLLWELCELICVQHLEQCLVQSRYSINVSCCYSLLVNSEFYIYSCRIWWSQARCCARHYRAVREFLLHSVHSFMFIRVFFFFSFLFMLPSVSLLITINLWSPVRAFYFYLMLEIQGCFHSRDPWF